MWRTQRANASYLLHLTITIYYHWPAVSMAENFGMYKSCKMQKQKKSWPTNRNASRPNNILFCRHMHTYIQFNPYLLERELVFTVCTIMKANDIGCSSFARHHHLFSPDSCILQDEMKFIYDTRLFGIIFYVLTGNMVVPGLYVSLSVSISSFLSIFL